MDSKSELKRRCTISPLQMAQRMWELEAENAKLKAQIEAAAKQPAIPEGWKMVSELAPPQNTYVLAFDSKRVIRACFIPSFTDSDCDYDGDNYDYRESDDTYWVPEGWYEGMEHWEEYSSVKVHREITHWMPLPAAPTPEWK